MNISKQVFRSIYSPKDIASFRNQSITKTILYIFLLTTIIILPLGVRVVQDAVEFTNSYITFAEENPNAFEIKDGLLTIENDETMVFDDNGLAVIIDSSTTNVDDTKADKYNAYIAVLKDKVVVSDGVNSEEIKYEGTPVENLTPGDISKVVGEIFLTATIITIIILFIIILLATFTLVLVTSSLFYFLGSISYKAKKLRYKNFFIITTYSTTLVAVFFMIIDTFNIYVTARNVIVWIVTILVTYLSIREVPSEKIPEQP